MSVTSHRMPCSAIGVCTVSPALKPTQASTSPGMTPPSAMPAFMKMQMSAFTMPATRWPEAYSLNVTTSGTSAHI